MSSRLPEIQVKYGIPQPETTTKPRFKAEGVISLRLNDFPANILPSGGLSGVISKSEMYMVKTCVPTTMRWINENTGAVIGSMIGTWSMIGRYPWEITMPGMYKAEIAHKGEMIGFVEFEVR